MTPPTGRPFPRFIANSAQEKLPYGRWEERLTEQFAEACAEHAQEAGAPLDPETIRWFPERGWGGRVYVPATGRAAENATATNGAEASEAVPIEYYGHVSFVRPDSDGEPSDLRARADFTDVTADDNPDWRIDLSDDVLGRWRADGDRGGDVTLIWGLPMVRGAVAATAELDEEVVDQAPVDEGRFTLLAVDAVQGFGDDLYLTIRLWGRTRAGMREVAAESLYDDAEDPAEKEDED